MKIVIIGSGNVAYHLSKALVQNQVSLEQIYGRNREDLEKISDELNVPFSTDQLADADFYLIAVSDDSISEISKKIQKNDCLVVHTSGSQPLEILQGEFRKGSFYPLQTFSKAKALNYAEIPFFIEAENEKDADFLKNLALKISKNVLPANSEMRKNIHITAVFACNFVNHLFSRAKEIAEENQIPFEFFLPLIHETVKKIDTIDPKLAQTGPAVRNDTGILELQEQMLSGEHLEIYKTMNKSIKKMYEL